MYQSNKPINGQRKLQFIKFNKLNTQEPWCVMAAAVCMDQQTLTLMELANLRCHLLRQRYEEV